MARCWKMEFTEVRLLINVMELQSCKTLAAHSHSGETGHQWIDQIVRLK